MKHINCHIREATRKDIAQILAIVNDAILNTTSNYHYESQTLEAQTNWFETKMQHNFPIIVAVFEQKVIGFGTYGTFREKIGYQYTVEHSVYVSPDCVGKTVGTALLTHLIEMAKKQGFHTMIGAIDAANKKSIAFHEKFGFKTVGHIKEVAYKFDNWLDLVLMQLIF